MRDPLQFEFTTPPFGRLRDARLLFLNRDYQEAYMAMRWGVKSRRGLILVTGAAGSGKTTLAGMALERFEADVAVARVAIEPRQSFTRLLGAILIEYGLRVPLNKASQLQELQRFGAERSRRGQIAALFIDDVHNADRRLLEDLSMLIGVDAGIWLQTVLIGRPQLAETLRGPGLRLDERIALKSEVKPLAAAEVIRYIEHRLHIAGHTGGGLFSGDALAHLARLTGGIPRSIDSLCERALGLARQRGESEISRDTVDAAHRSLTAAPPPGPPGGLDPSSARASDAAPHTPPAGGAAPQAEGRPREDGSGPQRAVTAGRRRRIAALVGSLLTGTLAAAALLVSGVNRPFEAPAAPETGSSSAPRPGDAGSAPRIEPPGPEAPAALPSHEPAEPEPVIAPPERLALKPAPSSISSVPASLPAPELEKKVFFHTSAARDLDLLSSLGETLRVRGYEIPQARLSQSPTGGDVRFFFHQDRRAAERIRTTLQGELRRRGFDIALRLLERDGARFQFAAPGKIEVWLPPLGP